MKKQLCLVGVFLVFVACSTSGPISDPSSPSPDGTTTFSRPDSDSFEIAFVSRRDGFWSIYVVNEEGEQRRLLDITSVQDGPQRFALDLLGQPDWSPDGLQLLFTCTPGRSEVCLANADGSLIRQITRDRGDPENYPAWMPDGDRLVFSSYRGGSFDVHSIKSDGSAERELVTGPGDESSPAVSADGEVLAYVERRDGRFDLHLARLEDSRQTEPFHTIPNASMPAWSPVARELLFVRTRAERFSDVYRFELGAERAERISRSPGLDMSPTWAPDGTAFAFTRDEDFDGEQYQASDLYMHDLTTGELRNVTNDGRLNLHPSWRPVLIHD